MAAQVDIETALDIIEENGGAGDWETGAEGVRTESTPRWHFPRFPGADTLGTCGVEDDPAHEGIHQQTEDCGESFAVDPGNLYLSRRGLGPYDTDVETLEAWLEAPRNIVGAVLLLGEPGTGKTALAEAAATRLERPMTTVVCTPDHTKDSLFLRFVGEDHGDVDHNGNRTPYTLGPIPYAAKHGHILYMDEVMLLVDGVKPILYSLADGRHFLPEGNVDGSPLEIHPDFRLILSSNPLVRGASLPEPLASRCAGTTLHVETDKSMLLDLGIDESIVEAWHALKTGNLWTPQIREMRVADYWLTLDPTLAAAAMVPEHCPESQRQMVRDVVLANIGGGLREDGRLVVS